METTTNDIGTRGATQWWHGRRGATRDVTASAAGRQEARRLIVEIENLLRCVKVTADPEVARARAEVESAVAATKRALA
jgi:hypothetical protein